VPPQAKLNTGGLYYELLQLKEYFSTHEHKKHTTWKSFASELLSRSFEEVNPQLNTMIEEAKVKQKTSERIGFVKEGVMNMIKQKQIEMFGNEPKSTQEQILTISDPAKRKKLLMQDNKC
jgi:hypothetical protein